jgi:hypothetical protein
LINEQTYETQKKKIWKEEEKKKGLKKRKAGR